jgi:hypothetical protein
MEIPKKLLIGNETEIKTVFQIAASEIGAVKLKVSIREQKSLTGSTNGSQITYKDASGNQQNFSASFEKLLSEIIDLAGLDVHKRLSEFKVDFGLVPASDAIQVKLHFELLDSSDKPIRSIEVEWIKSEIVIHLLAEFKGGETYFTLQNLKEDIKDPSKITLSIQSLHKNAFFLVEGVKKMEATLAELLPGINLIAKDQATTPIKIGLDNLKANEKSDFVILVLSPDTVASRLSVSDDKGYSASSELNPLAEQELEKFIKLKKEENKLEEKTREALKELDKQEKEALKGKNRSAQQTIKQDYKRKRKEIRESASEFEYKKGFYNSLKHNLFGIKLKDPKNLQYYQGQIAGHRVSAGIAKAELAVGPPLFGVGVGATVAGGIPTLGGIAVVTIPIIALGGGFIGHGIYVSERAQANLAAAAAIKKDVQDNANKGAKSK